ncbi:transporter (plasmid) [Fulvitalea axinellae]|uniref:Transporter n=1 Tax=Fulvitalea axinellae TaxID=1182444 RepID=A0AAU9CNN3_9BACT|nr:transporter [Fulvitalea axinellae]
MDSKKRLVLVDALRGWALFMIVLIHFVEKFNFYIPPEVNWLFSPETDRAVFEYTFLLISGKAYSIFALLFGLSFFIQLNNQESRGVDFRKRFLWRLFVLMVLGLVHSLVYDGDILSMYAIMGFPLVALYKVHNRYLIALAVLLIIQTPLLAEFGKALLDPDYVRVKAFGTGYWQEGKKAFAEGSFWDVISFNFWKGRMQCWSWTYYTGRFFQLFGLFLIGLVLGRKGFFNNIKKYKKALTVTLVVSLIMVGVFYTLEKMTGSFGFSKGQHRLFSLVVDSYGDFSFIVLIVTIFSLAYIKTPSARFFTALGTYGKMSLTNYVTQGFLGPFFFYGFGLGMWRYFGATWCLMLGFLFFGLQLYFSHRWCQKFHYGPIEWLWRALTYMDFSIPNKKKVVEKEVLEV